MACASPLRIFALRPSRPCQVVQQWLAISITIASPRPQACGRIYLRIAPATCVFTRRLSRTYPRAAPSTLNSGHLRTAFIIRTSHCASLQLTFALISLTPMHLGAAFITRNFTPRFPLRKHLAKTTSAWPSCKNSRKKFHQAAWRAPHHCVSSHCAHHHLAKAFSCGAH